MRDSYQILKDQLGENQLAVKNGRTWYFSEFSEENGHTATLRGFSASYCEDTFLQIQSTWHRGPYQPVPTLTVSSDNTAVLDAANTTTPPEPHPIISSRKKTSDLFSWRYSAWTFTKTSLAPLPLSVLSIISRSSETDQVRRSFTHAVVRP